VYLNQNKLGKRKGRKKKKRKNKTFVHAQPNERHPKGGEMENGTRQCKGKIRKYLPEKRKTKRKTTLPTAQTAER